MGDSIEDRLRRAARDLQLKPAAPRLKPHLRRAAIQTNFSASANNMPLVKNHHVVKRVWVKRAALAIVSAVVALLGVGFYMLARSTSSTHSEAAAQLPVAIVSQINDFVPYFFRDTPPQGFTFNAKNVSYSAGVLFFQVQDQSGNVVVVSEQALPSDFANSKPQGDQTVGNVDGNGAISNRDSRTIGTLITNKSPRALININAAQTVDAGAIKAIMTKLAPLPNKR